MKFRLRQAGLDDATAIHALLVECGQAMAVAGFDNWNPPAHLDQIASDIEEREVYMVFDADQFVATVTAATPATVAFDHPLRVDGEAKVLYVNRLAVKPSAQGRGIGAWLSGIMEDRGRALDCAVVRLDALIHNTGVVRFYERAGYERKFERERDGWRFVCLEKALRPVRQV